MEGATAFFLKIIGFGVIFAMFLLVGAEHVYAQEAVQEGTLQYNSNVRDIPGLGNILGVLSKGSRVKIVGESQGWYEVVYKEEAGWMAVWLFSDVTPVGQAQTVRPVHKEKISTQGSEKETLLEQIAALQEQIVQLQAQLAKATGQSKSGILAEFADASTEEEEDIVLASEEYEKEESPTALDVEKLEAYWAGLVNNEREERGLRELEIHEDLTRTAEAWALALGEAGLVTHIRKNGQSSHQWAESQGVRFTRRNSEGGWTRNYFTENLSWRYTELTQESVRKALENTLAAFLAEGPGGSHYQTVYHPDWNGVGVGFFHEPVSGSRYKTYMVFHYGSVQ